MRLHALRERRAAARATLKLKTAQVQPVATAASDQQASNSSRRTDSLLDMPAAAVQSTEAPQNAPAHHEPSIAEQAAAGDAPVQNSSAGQQESATSPADPSTVSTPTAAASQAEDSSGTGASVTAAISDPAAAAGPIASDSVIVPVPASNNGAQASGSVALSYAPAVSPAVGVAVAPPPGNDTGGAAGRSGSLLPSGYLSTHGNQIVDALGNPVRIASIGWAGTDSLTFAPYGLWQSSLQQNVDAIKADGFNTIRVPWTDALLHNSPLFSSSYAAFNPALDPELLGKTSLQMLDVLVADAAKDGLKIIFDHHDDDGGPGGWGGQQTNGLWIDSGPGTNGTDGSGTPGTVTAATFKADSVDLAQHFAGNSTVVGFDLDNEPTSAGDINWGQGGPTDIQAMYTQVGDAIQAVDPGALIIAEGPEEWSGPAPGLPAGFAEGDLSGVATDPVTLTIPDKVVYSVHEYPPDLSGNGSYTAAQQIAAMNSGWGYLETDNIAPVWIGETGSNMTSAADQGWIQSLLDYMNGADGSEGGPTFSGNEQPVSGSWWQWGSAAGQDPQGVETAWGSGSYWPAQQTATDQLLYDPTGNTTTVSAATLGTGSDTMPFLYPGSGAVTLISVANPSAPGTVELATVSNLGDAVSSGWAVELDTQDLIASVTGGVLSSLQPGAYLITPTATQPYIAAGGSTTFAVQIAGTASAISARLVQLPSQS